MDQEVANTLAALERKLAQLEHELMSSAGRHAGHGAVPPPPPSVPGDFAAQRPAPPPPAPRGFAAHPQPQQPEPAQPSGGFGGGPPSPGVLVDEATERRYSMGVSETAYGEIPSTRDSHDSIELGDLVRFREKMQRTLTELIDEYSRLLSLKPPADA